MLGKYLATPGRPGRQPVTQSMRQFVASCSQSAHMPGAFIRRNHAANLACIVSSELRYKHEKLSHGADACLIRNVGSRQCSKHSGPCKALPAALLPCTPRPRPCPLQVRKDCLG